jgi:hypothetical protein
VLVQVVQPIDSITESKRVVRTNKELSLVFVEGEELTVVGVALLMAAQVLLYVFKYRQSSALNQFVER